MEEEGLKELGKAMGLAKSTPGKVAPARTLKIMDHSTTQLFQEEIVVKDPNQLLAQKVISIIRRYGTNVPPKITTSFNRILFCHIFAGMSSQGASVSGTFGPGRLLGAPKPRAGLGTGKFSFM